MSLNKCFEYSIILGILCSAGFLRLYNLETRGLIYHDEGYYANAAKTPYYVCKWFLKDKDLQKDVSLRKYLESFGCSNPKEKPGHIALLSLGFLFFGMNSTSPLLVSAFFGMLCVIWMYVFGRQRLGFAWTVFSMALLSVSFLHLHYSRSALYVSSVFFSFFIFHLYIWSVENKPPSKAKWMLLSGVLLGFCASVDQKIIFFAGCLVLTDIFIFFLRRRASFLIVAKRQLALFGGLLLSTFFIELIFQFLYRNLNIISEYPTYISYFFQSKINAISDSYTWSCSDIFFYPKALIVLEGVGFFVLLVAGLIIFAKKAFIDTRVIYIFSFMLWLITLCFWTVRSGNHPSVKVISVLLPTGALAAGYVLKVSYDFICGKVTNSVFQKIILTCILVAIFFSGFIRALPLLALKNVYGKAVSEVAQKLEFTGSVVTFDQGAFTPLARFYFGLEAEGNPSLGKSIAFNQNSPQANNYFFSTWHNYHKEDNLNKLLIWSEQGKEILKIPDTSVRGLPPLLYYLRGGSVVQNGVTRPMAQYKNFSSVVVYESFDMEQ